MIFDEAAARSRSKAAMRAIVSPMSVLLPIKTSFRLMSQVINRHRFSYQNRHYHHGDNCSVRG